MGNILIKILINDTNNIMITNPKKLLKIDLSDIRNSKYRKKKKDLQIPNDYVKISKEDKFSIIDI